MLCAIAPSVALQVVKKSKFVSYAAYAASFEDAQRFVDSVSDPRATHNCWAYRSPTYVMRERA
jgi:putative IMPACT (imprinted ancient) family translation regulator